MSGILFSIFASCELLKYQILGLLYNNISSLQLLLEIQNQHNKKHNKQENN